MAIRTGLQFQWTARLLNELVSYGMDPNDDMESHIITVNKKIQESIWNGNLYLRSENNKYLMLKNTLITPSQKGLLEDIWKSDPNPKYSTLVKIFLREYVKIGARRTATLSISTSIRKGKCKVPGTPWLADLEFKV